MSNQVKTIIYGFDMKTGEPLDIRFKVPNLQSLPPRKKRYPGLIFFSVADDKPYIFLNNLNTPLPLFSLMESNIIFGRDISVESESLTYNNLLNELNATSPTIGSIVTIYPLQVSFIFDGSGWSYFNGTYFLGDTAQFNTIPNQLKKPHAKVEIVGNQHYIIASDLSLTTKIIDVLPGEELPTTPEDDKIYRYRGNYFYSYGGNFMKFSGEILVLNDFDFNVGSNEIVHNLNSAYFNIFCRINNYVTDNSIKVFQINDYRCIDLNTIEIDSDVAFEANTLIIYSQ